MNLSEIREDLKDIRYYYAHKDVFESAARENVYNDGTEFFNTSAYPVTLHNGVLRLAKFWNCNVMGELRYKLDTTTERASNQWILAKYDNGIFREIKRY